MAKRAPVGERPFNPLDESLVRSVMRGPDPARNEIRSEQLQAVGEGGGVALMEAPGPQPSSSPNVRHPNVVALPEPKIATKSQPEIRSARSDPAYIERRDREKRFLLTQSEERDVERLVERLAGELGTRMKLSHVLRAFYILLMHAEDELLERARKSPGLFRPGNGNAPELAEFEKNIASILSTAFREVTPLR